MIDTDELQDEGQPPGAGMPTLADIMAGAEPADDMAGAMAGELDPEAITLTPEEADELARLRAQEEEERLLASMQAFGAMVQKMVDEAVSAREQSGIESRWLEDLRQYYGSDWSLMSGQASVLDRVQAQDGSRQGVGGAGTKQRQPKSKIIVNITRPKTNAIIARLADMLLPTDDKNWGIRPTPNPDLVRAAGDEQTTMTIDGKPLMGPDGQPLTKAAVAKKVLDAAKEACEGMSREIEDALIECNYNAEFRRGLWYYVVLGTMVMRGPFAKTVRTKSWTKDPVRQTWVMKLIENEKPSSEAVPLWNFYPDPACGGDIRKSRYAVEMLEFNAKTLADLRGQPGFITSQINLCLQERPRSIRRGTVQRDQRFVGGEYQHPDDSIYDVAMVHGTFERGALEDAGVEECKCESEEERLETVSGCVFLCNGRPIKAALGLFDDGEIPYDVAPYEKVDGQVFGLGAPFLLRNPSRVVMAGWRMTMDNAALAGGAQVVYNAKLVDPADGQETITGVKLWRAKDGTEDVQKAFHVYQIPSRLPEILGVIDRALRFADDESSMPPIAEGGPDTKKLPDRVGVANLQMNSASTTLRQKVKTVDDLITDPHITRYYSFYMQHHPDDSIKGDYQVDARGTSVLLVRDAQRQSLLQVGQFVLHPKLGQFHKREGYDWLKTMYESHHIDASQLLIDGHEADVVVKKMGEMQPPPPPQIAVAQIRGEVEKAKLTATMEDSQREREFDMQKFDKQLQFEWLKYANQNNVTLEQVRTDLTKLLIAQRGQERMQMSKERMQAAELEVKQRTGSGI